MKVLLLCKYSDLGASSRLRALQYLPFLHANGIEVTVAPLLTDNYLWRIYARTHKDWIELLGSYLRRIRALLATHRYDLLWIEKEIFPRLPALFEYLIASTSTPYIVDYDDAVFHDYDLNPHWAVRRLLGRKIDTVMRLASVVIAGNRYLAERATAVGARRVEILPTAVSLQQYSPRQRTSSDELFTVVWIGTPVTAKFLRIVDEPLANAARMFPLKVKLIGSGPVRIEGVDVEVCPWSAATESQELQSCDLGIMPLFDSPFERGKCGYKLIQYMACGLPTIASPVGVNKEIVGHGVTGFWANTASEWVNGIVTIANERQLWARLGAAGRKQVEAKYCMDVTAPRLLEILRSAVKTDGK